MLIERVCTNLGIVDRYPAVPSPTILEPNWLVKYEVLTKFAKFAVLTNPPGIVATALEIYPAVPRPIIVEPS